MHAIASFGAWVKQCRMQLDLTQELLAERVGCAVQTIRKIEAGARRPSLLMAERLAQALEVPSEECRAFLKAARAGGTSVLPELPAVPRETPPARVPVLPTFPTRFVGRVAEQAELLRLLTDSGYRLITVVGPGGIGKTRLAVEAAQAYPESAGAVIFVALAPISTAALLVPAIASALGLTFHGSEPPASQLLRYLKAQELLLVLDNMEHVLDGAALLVQILEQAPRVKLLVTSRERLSLQGEWVVHLMGLPIWQADAPADADAVILFVERARQARHDFQLTADNRHAVEQICRLLEGMPLGIELAATWVRVLSCAAIAEELARSLDFLQAPTRDLPERHRSMRAVFAHSWQLLDMEEQRVLRQLAVFRGGFTRAAAEQVVGATLPLLAALVDKSLVRRVGADRYDLHELVRQYAAAHLERDPREHAATQDRHCAYFATLLAEREQPLKSALQHATFAELAVEIDNLRQAWRWAALSRRIADMCQAIPTLFVFYEIQGSYQEAAAIFRQAAEALEAVPGTSAAPGPGLRQDEGMLLGEVLAAQAWFTFRHGQFAQARDLLRRSLALLGPHSTEAALSTSLPYLWMLRPGRGDYAEAHRLLRQRLELQRARGDQWEVARSLLHLGVLAKFQGDHAAGYQLLREALALTRTTGDPIATVRVLGFASGAACEIGAYEEARHLAQECLVLNRDLGSRFTTAHTLNALGLVAHAQGQYLEARARFEESLALFKELGDRWHIARVLSNLGHTLHALGSSPEAYQIFLEALATAMEAQTLQRELDALIGLAILLREQGKTEQAAELCLHVLQQAAGSQRTKAQAEQLWSDLQATLSQEQLAALEERERARTSEVVVAELLS